MKVAKSNGLLYKLNLFLHPYLSYGIYRDLAWNISK